MLSQGLLKTAAAASIGKARNRDRLAALPPDVSKAQGKVDIIGYSSSTDKSDRFSRLWGDEMGVSMGLEKALV